jgi:ubiquinone/menaquinone biosynthesis C-methylase UbiE
MLGAVHERDPIEVVRAHFDALAEGEWNRLVSSPRSRVSLELHRRMLARFIQPGARVLEVGAGPGRFTIELVDLEATVVVSDVSTVQLALNDVKVTDAGRDHAVEDRLVLDVRDLSRWGEDSFDAVVAYGGPISYAFERAEEALGECLRVTRPGGVVLASVMTTLGTMRLFLGTVVNEIDTFGIDVTEKVMRTGDLRHTPDNAHRCRMFRWRELEDMFGRLPCRLVAASASNAVSAGDPNALSRLAGNAEWWERFLDWEEELAQEPGALDGGTHTIFVLERA